MFNQDILLHVTSKTDNKTLEILSKTSLWNDIKKFAETSQFWKMRTENLVGEELKYSSKNWKNIYYILDEALKNPSPFSVVDTSEVVAVQILLDLDYDPHYPGTRDSVFHRAAEKGHSEVIKLLLSDIRFDPEESNSSLALFIAAQNGHSEAIKLLLVDERIDPSPGETWEEDALIMACKYNHPEVVKLLLADGRFDPSPDASGLCLPYAIEDDRTEADRLLLGDQDRTEVVRLLLADPRVDPTDRYDGGSILSLACSFENIGAVRLLLEDSRIDPSEDNNEAIQQAASVGNIEIIKLLLSDKRVRSSGGGNQALVAASEEDRSEVVKLLLREPSVDPSYNDYQAIRIGSKEIVELFLSDKRVKLNKKIFLLAVRSSRAELVALLLTYPTRSITGYFLEDEALPIAIEHRYSKMVNLLLSDSRVRLSKIDRFLEVACKNGDVEVVKLLLAYPHVKKLNPVNAIKIAIKRRYNTYIQEVDLILRDERVDLDWLIKNIDLDDYLLVAISSRISVTQREHLDPAYLSLVLLLILRRPSFEEALKWMLLHPNREMRDAARSLISGEIDYKYGRVAAYLGFFLLAIPDMNLEKIEKLLEAEGADDWGIRLAAGLIAAHLNLPGHINTGGYWPSR